MTITSVHNPSVVAAAKLQRRRERERTGQTLVEGPHAVAAALEAGVEVVALFASEDDRQTVDAADLRGVGVTVVSPSVLRKLADTEHPQGPLMVIAIPQVPRLSRADTLVLAGLGDPGNCGTLIRSAVAFGFRIAFTAGTVDPWSPKVLRSAAGAHFATSVSDLATAALEHLHAAGHRVLAAVPRGGNWPPSRDVSRPVSVMVGAEPAGLPGALRDGADDLVTIPAAGVESLNAAVAGSIIMYELARSRRREDSA